MLKSGDTAPLHIQVTDQNGTPVTLQQFAGNKVIVYFYPKDDTPGCTKEACGIRDDWTEFSKLGVTVLGVSPDREAAHQKFIEKYQLPFTLLCDPDHQLAEAFGAWGEKKNYGKTYMGLIRSTFILNAQGLVSKVFPRVKAEGHAQQLLKALTSSG
ncbi:MAG: thioredoxin-dependent thiol peroxidase [SAR324 cluster bacterium]|nr:thioredoxin-dependent thiol peroxidase [SAR324 cluster bacterium]MBF0351466.1 thioredoxin-dependent thiol peroxidase [SAR324 cluster bacterium]